MSIPANSKLNLGNLLDHDLFPGINYKFNISLKYKYVYCETPKVACSGIKKFLIRNEYPYIAIARDVHNREFSPLLSPKQVMPFTGVLKSPDFYKFCVVREPYGRLLSAYLEKIVNNKPQVAKIKNVLGIGSKVSYVVPFDDFVKAVCQTPYAYMDPHWRPQFYQNHVGAIKYTNICKLENFTEEFPSMCEAIGLDFSLYEDSKPHMTGASDKVSEFYTETLKDMVYEKFEEDFTYFGYSK